MGPARLHVYDCVASMRPPRADWNPIWSRWLPRTHVRFGSSSRAAARFGRRSCAARSPDDAVVRTLYSGISRGTETLVFAGSRAGERARADARAVSGRRLSGAREVRLQQRRHRRKRAGRACGPARVLPLSASDTLCRARGRAARAARRRAACARRARGEPRDRGEWALGPRAARRRSRRGHRRGHGRLSRRVARRAHGRRGGSARRRRLSANARSRPSSASRSLWRTMPRATSTSSCTRAARRPASGWRSSSRASSRRCSS